MSTSPKFARHTLPLGLLLAMIALLSASFALKQPFAHAANACASSDVKDNVVNVKDFGAAGNGTTDDTAAIRAAVACVVSLFPNTQVQISAGATLYFPKGTYLVANGDGGGEFTIDPVDLQLTGGGIVIRGDGSNASTIVTNSSKGLFSLLLPDTVSMDGGAVMGLDVHDIGFVADIPGAGAVIDLSGTKTITYGTAKKPVQAPGPRLHLHMTNVNISGANVNDYFIYGLNATGLNLPSINNVQMTGGGGAACYAFGYSYGIWVDNSSCSGAATGVYLPNAAEGDQVYNSQFTNVGTAISITSVPYFVPGPSSDEGKVWGNTIQASSTGVSVSYKAWFFITHNIFESNAGNSAYRDISLANDKTILVDNNSFVGGGTNRTGVVLSYVQGPGKAVVATISANTFGSFATGVNVSSGVNATTIVGNMFSTTRSVLDKGTGTYVSD